MSKIMITLSLVGLTIISLNIVYYYYKTTYQSLPYGQLTPDSKECHLIINDKETCEKSGCIYGSGDLTGPPFCGAYK